MTVGKMRSTMMAMLGDAWERTRVVYRELGVTVQHRRVKALEDALRPAWLETALG